MPKESGHKKRILYVLKFLAERTDEDHGISVLKLLELLKSVGINAERKTLYDDIEQLKEFGYDIRLEKGKEGGYRLVDRDFELSELVLLTDAVQSSRFITEKKSATLIKKLASLTSAHQGKSLSRQVQVSGRIKNMNETIFYSVDTLHNAIDSDKRISFNYFDHNRLKERVFRHDGKLYKASPLSLCWDNEYYYLVAQDDETGDIRHYRVDKMANISLLEDTRKKVEGFSAATYTDKLFGMFGGKESLVTLRCKDHLAGEIFHRVGKSIPFTLGDHRYFQLRARLVLSPVFYGWVMSFGGDIIIKSPAEAVEELNKTAAAVLATHKNGG